MQFNELYVTLLDLQLSPKRSPSKPIAPTDYLLDVSHHLEKREVVDSLSDDETAILRINRFSRQGFRVDLIKVIIGNQ